jgi:hypothetical protein
MDAPRRERGLEVYVAVCADARPHTSVQMHTYMSVQMHQFMYALEGVHFSGLCVRYAHTHTSGLPVLPRSCWYGVSETAPCIR